MREGAQSRRRLRRGHRQGMMMIPLLQFLRLLPRHRHLVQQRQDVGPLGLREKKEQRIYRRHTLEKLENLLSNRFITL